MFDGNNLHTWVTIGSGPSFTTLTHVGAVKLEAAMHAWSETTARITQTFVYVPFATGTGKSIRTRARKVVETVDARALECKNVTNR